MPKRLPLFVRLWFAADIALALLPPVHWAAGSGALVLGAPGIIVYFLGASVVFSASVLAAYACDPSLGDRKTGALAPLPLAGRGKGWGSGRASPTSEKSTSTPTPDPSPQGGGETRGEV